MTFYRDSFLKIIVVTILLSILIMSFVFIVLLLCSRGGKKVESISTSISKGYRFQYLQVDSSRNQTFFGITSRNKDLQPDIDYETTEISRGILTMISRFGKDEFICTGSCYYYHDGEVRKSANPLILIRGGVLFLVTAISSVVAMNIAYDHILRKCERILHEENMGHSHTINVEAEVEKCTSSKEGVAMDQDISSSTSGSKRTTEFQCHGICSPTDWKKRIHYFDEVYEPIEAKRGYKKERFWNNIAVDALRQCFYDRCVKMELTTIVNVERIGSFELQELNAENLFSSVHLHKFCRGKNMLDLDEIMEYWVQKNCEAESEEVSEYFSNDIMNTLFKRYLQNAHSDVVPVCGGKKYFEGSGVHEIGLEVGVVCRRIFTTEEWESGVPYEHNNLRHWKKENLVRPTG